MESASPEPSRRAAGAAVEGRVAADDPPYASAVSRTDAGHRVAVVDEQTDLGVAVVDVVRIERLARYVLVELDVPAELELSITCVDLGRIAELNVEHLGGTGPTDVLAFPIDGVADVVDGVPGVLGDVVVCPDVAAAQAPEHGRTARGEVDLLVVHGILHLLGHDHAEDDERARMFGLTDALLAGFADITGVTEEAADPRGDTP